MTMAEIDIVSKSFSLEF